MGFPISLVKEFRNPLRRRIEDSFIGVQKKNQTGQTANLDKLPGGERWRREREIRQPQEGRVSRKRTRKARVPGKACLGFRPVSEKDFKKEKKKNMPRASPKVGVQRAPSLGTRLKTEMACSERKNTPQNGNGLVG